MIRSPPKSRTAQKARGARTLLRIGTATLSRTEATDGSLSLDLGIGNRARMVDAEQKHELAVEIAIDRTDGRATVSIALPGRTYLIEKTRAIAVEIAAGRRASIAVQSRTAPAIAPIEGSCGSQQAGPADPGSGASGFGLKILSFTYTLFLKVDSHAHSLLTRFACTPLGPLCLGPWTL